MTSMACMDESRILLCTKNTLAINNKQKAILAVVSYSHPEVDVLI